MSNIGSFSSNRNSQSIFMYSLVLLFISLTNMQWASTVCWTPEAQRGLRHGPCAQRLQNLVELGLVLKYLFDKYLTFTRTNSEPNGAQGSPGCFPLPVAVVAVFVWVGDIPSTCTQQAEWHRDSPAALVTDSLGSRLGQVRPEKQPQVKAWRRDSPLTQYVRREEAGRCCKFTSGWESLL